MRHLVLFLLVLKYDRDSIAHYVDWEKHTTKELWLIYFKKKQQL